MALKSEKAEAIAALRKILRPGQTVYTVLRHVSASGMSRRIDLYTIRRNRPVFLTGYVGRALDYPRSRKHDGLTVGGCGMDMGFHLVHSLGYALWGSVAQKGTSRKATALRKRLGVVCRHYLCQGGAELPDPTIPGVHWYGAAGYALSHSRL